MDDQDEHEILDQPDSKTMDTAEWQETLHRHEAQQSQRHREEKAERAKASTARAKALLQQLKDDEPRMQAELAAIRQRREMYGEPETPTATSAPVMNAGQRQVRESYMQQRPTMDADTQKLWDDFVDARCRNMISGEEFSKRMWKFWADEFAEVLGTETGKAERELRDEINKTFATVRKELNEHIAISNENIKSVDENSKTVDEDLIEVNKQLTKLRKEVAKLRKEMTSARSTNVVELPNPLKRKQHE